MLLDATLLDPMIYYNSLLDDVVRGSNRLGHKSTQIQLNNALYTKMNAYQQPITLT